MSKEPCQFPPDAIDSTGCVPFEVFARVMAEDCTLTENVCFTMSQTTHDKHGHLLDGDYDPKGAGGCDHRETPEWQAEHQSRERKMSKPKEAKHEEAKHEEAAAPAAPVAAMEEVATEKLKAVTEQPAVTTAANELSSIIGHDITGMQVVMAVVAVGGGGAAWKFYSQRQKLKHEEKMAEMESHKSKKHDRKDDDHGSCKVERAALEARVVAAEQRSEALERRVAELAKKAEEGPEFEFDADEIEERVEKLERLFKKMKREQEKAAQDDDDDDDV